MDNINTNDEEFNRYFLFAMLNRISLWFKEIKIKSNLENNVVMHNNNPISDNMRRSNILYVLKLCLNKYQLMADMSVVGGKQNRSSINRKNNI